MGIVWENMTPGTELLRMFCAGIGVVLVGNRLFNVQTIRETKIENKKGMMHVNF